ncbi:hypothetical protein DPEC_G00329620 [Dallia pectoralis]|uniref:Uncharacterized protein n=1 Tax=Dallia pectoralis TaxID=75939 RepID=A0ACC2F8X9_DALPE|nr:hypothetical protein DPEC_G00329620 [Dallia pectoralis]
MSASDKADMEVKLKALDCHFTWSIEKADIKDLDQTPEKLLDRIMYSCPLKCHATYYNLLAFLSHLDGNNTCAIEYLYKAKVEAYIGKVEKISQSIPKASKIQGSLPSVHAEKGWSLIRLGGFFYRRAKDSFEKALKGKPDNASYNVGYAIVLYRLEGMAYNKKGKSVESQATTQLKKALSMEPDNSEIMVLLALKLQNQNKAEALKLVAEALRLSPDVPHVVRYAAKFFRYEDSSNEAIHLLGKALELSPNSHFIHHQIGLCHKQQLYQMFKQKKQGGSGGKIKAKVEVCIRHFSRAVELKPSNIYAKVDLAEAYGNIYQMEEAMKIFTSLLRDKSINDSDKQHCYTGFGVFLFYKKKDEARAVTQFKNAYQIQIESRDRKEAGNKLRQIAERWQADKKRTVEANEILTFLKTQDTNERKTEEPKTVLAHSSKTDDLANDLRKGMKLK